MNFLEEDENYFKILKALSEATKFIRDLFIKKWTDLEKTDWTDDKKSGEFFLNGVGSSILSNLKFKAQKKYLESGNSLSWDLPLLCIVLSNEHFKLGKLECECIKNIVNIRNDVSHMPNYSLNDSKFKALWKGLLKALADLGYPTSNFGTERIGFNNDQNEKKAKQYKEKGNIEFKNGNFKEALELYSSAIILSNISDQITGILYCNRSLAYLKLHLSSPNKIDQRNLMRSLNDAQMAVNLSQKWFKAYFRLGQIYKELNDLEKSIENLKLAHHLDSSVKEVKDLLEKVKYDFFEQLRKAHLDEHSMPRRTEEMNRYVFDKYVAQTGAKNFEFWNKLNNHTKTLNPIRADVWLGHEYFRGSDKVEQNYVKAAEYYAKAASAGSADGLYNLGILTQDGLGVKKDLKAALAYFKKAADQDHIDESEVTNVGVAAAEHYLGILYHNGIIVEKDIAKAVLYYNRAVEHCCPNASTNLGCMYLNGLGFGQDFDLAERNLLLAYKRGDNNAMVNLVSLYTRKNDPDKALLWHQRAVDKNSLKDIGRDEEIRYEISFLKSLSYNGCKKIQPKKQSILMDPNRINLIKSHRKSLSANLLTFNISNGYINIISNTNKVT